MAIAFLSEEGPFVFLRDFEVIEDAQFEGQ